MELSKEEKEAIEKFREYIDYCENNKECREELKQCFGCSIEVEEINSMKIVLNLISKLQKENEKQGKVIDEMTEHIVSSAIVDDMVCMYIDCTKEECHGDTARKCTKQYFYGKVERR